MLTSFLSLLIFSSTFESDSGLSIELKSTSVFYDTDGSTSTGGGARLSYVSTNSAEAFLSFEIESSIERVFGSENEFRWLGGGNLTFNETYGPFAFRFALGLLTELHEDWHFGGAYRFGLGYYWTKNFGNFIDYGNRFIAKPDSDSNASFLDFSFQFIF